MSISMTFGEFVISVNIVLLQLAVTRSADRIIEAIYMRTLPRPERL